MMAVQYMVALCRNYVDAKTSGESLLYKNLCSKLLSWLMKVANANPKYGKYTNLVLMENTYYIVEEL